MLRHVGAVTALAGAAFTVLPGLAQDQSADGPRVRALLQAARERDRAIHALDQLHTRLVSREPQALGQVRTITEAPVADPQAQDQRLEELRAELAQLELTLEAVRGTGGAGDVVPSTGNMPRIGLTVGLDADELSLLRPSAGSNNESRALGSGSQMAPVRNGQVQAPVADVPGTPSTLAPADRLRQARSAFLAEQYTKSLSLLEGLEASPEVLHWRARSYERLDRLDEALGALRLAAADPRLAEPAVAALAARVKADLEYVDWMRKLRRARTDADANSAAATVSQKATRP